MIGRHIFSLRKLVYLCLVIAFSLLVMHIRLVLLPSMDEASTKNADVLPRIFTSDYLQMETLSKKFSVPRNHPNDTGYFKLAMRKRNPTEDKLKLMGIEIINDPLDLRLQVHPRMSERDAEDVFHRYVSELHVECKRHVRLGNVTDGGWDMCVAGPYMPANDSCLVYSFGFEEITLECISSFCTTFSIRFNVSFQPWRLVESYSTMYLLQPQSMAIGDNWSFDNDISKRFGCVVRSFDPSINSADHQGGPGVLFYNIGIGSSNSVSSRGWKLMTLSDILAMCHDDNKIIDYLKIDVESHEWDAFEEILRGNILSHVKQLAFEIHTKELSRVQSSVADLVKYWKILHGLEVAGFRRWYWHFNLWGFFPSRTLEKYLSCCYEVVYPSFLDTSILTDVEIEQFSGQQKQFSPAKVSSSNDDSNPIVRSVDQVTPTGEDMTAIRHLLSIRKIDKDRFGTIKQMHESVI